MRPTLPRLASEPSALDDSVLLCRLVAGLQPQSMSDVKDKEDTDAMLPMPPAASPASLTARPAAVAVEKGLVTELERFLGESCDSWTFDAFRSVRAARCSTLTWGLQKCRAHRRLEELSEGHGLSVLSYYLLSSTGLLAAHKIKPNRAARLFLALEVRPCRCSVTGALATPAPSLFLCRPVTSLCPTSECGLCVLWVCDAAHPLPCTLQQQDARG